VGKKLGYGIGSLGYSVVGQTISNYFMFFATCILGIRGSIVGLVIVLAVVVGMIGDLFEEIKSIFDLT